MCSCYSDGWIDVRLVASKSRVAPLKKQSTSRLELLRTILLARLVNKFNSAAKPFKTGSSTGSIQWQPCVGSRMRERGNRMCRIVWKKFANWVTGTHGDIVQVTWTQPTYPLVISRWLSSATLWHRICLECITFQNQAPAKWKQCKMCWPQKQSWKHLLKEN